MAHSDGSVRYEEPSVSYTLAGRAVSQFAHKTAKVSEELSKFMA
jgi:hypothetical protein